MTAKWTPGPWVKDRRGDLRGSDGKQVGTWDAGIAWVSRDDEAEANARLMAAAPELLEALKACLEWMEETRACGDCGFWDWTPGDTYMRGIQTVAQAEGSAP